MKHNLFFLIIIYLLLTINVVHAFAPSASISAKDGLSTSASDAIQALRLSNLKKNAAATAGGIKQTTKTSLANCIDIDFSMPKLEWPKIPKMPTLPKLSDLLNDLVCDAAEKAGEMAGKYADNAVNDMLKNHTNGAVKLSDRPEELVNIRPRKITPDTSRLTDISEYILLGD